MGLRNQVGNTYVNTQLSSADVRIVRETGTTEPVTIEEAKNYLRINNTQDDALITSMIKSARRDAERYLNSDIVAKERVVYYDVLTNEINLYFAPVASIDSITIDGTAVPTTDYEQNGLDNPKISLNNTRAEKVEITYTTLGRDFDDVKIGILALIAWKYYGRDAEMSNNWKAWLSPYKIYGYYGVR